MKKLSIRAVCIAAAVAITIISGCADMKVTPAGPVPDTRIATPDGALADAVRWQLANQPSLGGQKLSVSAKDGEVTLKGDLDNGDQLVRIATLVQSLPGVRAVIPDVNVKN
jgi:osmotically-inducible protein OsmY